MVELILRAQRLAVRGPRSRDLTPIHPNVGLAAIYRTRLDRLLREMHESVVYWLKATWRKEPTLAHDAPVGNLHDLFKRLGRRWDKRLEALAPELAQYFAQQAADRVSIKLKGMLKDAGLSVEFVMSRPVRDAYQAVITENVGLIKSIAAEHLGKVEQEVMRSVATGRDLGTLTKNLEAQYGLTRRRAALIARDQNNKATAIITRARQLELGITTARWRHSHGGRQPRPTHVKMDSQTYDVAKGMWDEDERAWVFPGQLINCRCVSVPVIQGFG